MIRHHRAAVAVALGCLAVAALSLLLPFSLAYDPWAWLVWGREVIHLGLDTRHGPSWKPLPVAFTTLFGLVPAAAPVLWAVVARAGLLGAVALGARLARRLAGGGAPGALAAVLAVLGLLFMGGLPRVVFDNSSEGLALLGLLAMFDRLWAGRPRLALACGCFAGLVRPEVWLLLAILGVAMIREDRRHLRYVALLGGLTLVAWIVPDWIGSHDILRAVHRASARDPGTYSRRSDPTGAALDDIRHILLPATLAGILAAAVLGGRRLRRLLLAGVLVLAVVVIGVARGEAGNSRYLLTGAGVGAVVGGAGWGLLAARIAAAGPDRRRSAALAVTIVAARAASANDTPYRIRVTRYQAEVSGLFAGADGQLAGLIALARTHNALTHACGRPAVDQFAVPVLAWYLGVHIRDVDAYFRPHTILLQQRIDGYFLPAPLNPGRSVLVHGSWRILRGPCPPVPLPVVRLHSVPPP